MPNWCYNTIDIIAEPETIQRFEKFLEDNKGEDWFSFFHPMPEDIKNSDQAWYEWAINNWGCKWNCSARDWEVSEHNNRISFSFDSPWGPPIALYDFMSNEFEDVVIEAKYLEEGMGFVGQYIDGIDESYEYSCREDLDLIPEELVDYWNLHDQFFDEDEEDEEE